MSIVVVWEFTVKSRKRAQFEKAYRSRGPWACLMKKGKGFEGLMLIRKGTGTYVTLDRWKSQRAYDDFHKDHASAYTALDCACQGLTASERLMGIFTVI
ncbi:MAG TPA: antibiotic biosynthesis monooxygenase [Dongiaceae bacterium]|jgi:heme-degrading monooxygenase HmoA|nr:antibiotic biosynthesis monooxygenase [Dongiaceae bacterium]